MAAVKAVGRRSKGYQAQRTQHYRLVKRTLGDEVAYVIQRNPPHRPGIWFDFEGFDNEHQARIRFRVVTSDEQGVVDVVLDRKIKHTRAAKVLATANERESET